MNAIKPWFTPSNKIGLCRSQWNKTSLFEIKSLFSKYFLHHRRLRHFAFPNSSSTGLRITFLLPHVIISARWRSSTRSPWIRSTSRKFSWTGRRWARAAAVCRPRSPTGPANRCWGRRARKARGTAPAARSRSCLRLKPEN